MENNKWEIKELPGHAIADTGDYSESMYMLTNGEVELITKDEIELEAGEWLAARINAMDVKWEDWKLDNALFELHLMTQNSNRWKEIAEYLYTAIWHYMENETLGEGSGRMNYEMQKFREAANQLM